MKVLVADPIADEGVARLRQAAEVDVKTKLSVAELCTEVQHYDALVVRSQTKVTADVIEHGRNLRVIGRAGVGVDNIDVEAATRCGIVVVNAPSGNTVSAAEHTMALMLALARNVTLADADMRKGGWSRGKLMGSELRNKTLGIVGLGNIGTQVAVRAQAFEMRTIAYDPFVSPEYARTFKVTVVSLEELLSEADFVTLHIPLSPATKNLIGPVQLARMKPTARLINCARGGLADEAAVAAALTQGTLAGAAFDVFTEEPPTGNPLLTAPRSVLTPHLGASTFEAQTNVSIDIADQVLTVLQGRMSKYAVNAPHASPETLPFLRMGNAVGSFAAQLLDGQLQKVAVRYCGELANADCAPVKAAVVSGLLSRFTEERVNLVNAELVAQQRGLRVVEETDSRCDHYSHLLTLTLETDAGRTSVSGTVRDGQTRIVQVNDFWMDLNLAEGHFLLCDHVDGPGLVGAIGTVLGKADINISSMHLSRLAPRGKALLIMALDTPLGEAQRRSILAIPNVHTAKTVSPYEPAF
ncbi:MAG: phosphoglycerate dehydrogenase [Dehalococcoidia bacterium]|nr:phosphoglycerate dehydrogenase [Dehalococcoidia bacterium]